MTGLDMSTLTERLALHVHSLQEGFEELSLENTVPGLAEHFAKILSGNLMTTDINIFKKDEGKKDWDMVYGKSPQSLDAIPKSGCEGSFSFTKLAGPDYNACVCTSLADNTRCAVVVGNKLDKSDYTNFEYLSLQLFVQLLANAYSALQNRKNEKELIFSLNHRIVQLNSLIDTGIQISRLDKDKPLMLLGLERAVALTNASRGCVRIAEDGELKETLHFPSEAEDSFYRECPHQISAGFDFMGRNYSFAVFEKESRSGCGPFEPTDELLLASLARQIHVAMENHELHQQALDKQKMEQELAVAGEIQRNLLPDTLPEIPGYDLYGINIPTKEVGGDFYDCMPLPDGRYALIIADVSGKGIPASLLVNSFHAALHSFFENDFDLSNMVQKLNRVIFHASPMNKFITAFFAVLDPATGELEYVSAGHNPAFISTPDKEIITLHTGGVILGMMDMELPFGSEKITLEPGERFFLYTDGIPEASKLDDDIMYEDETLEQFFQDHPDLSAQTFVTRLLDEVFEFTEGAPQSDDITALYIKRAL